MKKTDSLFFFLSSGHFDIVELLIEHDDFSAESGEMSPTDVNASREDGITPVFTAAWLGRIDVLRLLLRSGASANPVKSNTFDDTPLCGAINR